ncbi:MAG: quercetin 2,3-dioxygenase [Gammaproteobacteria bacterium]|nr:MAG: quercetin 2,3-dioxygenase [Gammaproteobacteria bacterium]
MNKFRQIKQVINGIPSSDGDGVQLTRLIGSAYLEMLDPFLLFDAFGSDKPQDYIGGFPAHPHRGFETVSYMLAGKMRHKDSVGNEGIIEAGGVQWMTAGKGIIHSEMPEQENGLLSGFQLWVNLPASEKMVEPKYQEKSAEDIPIEYRDNVNSSSGVQLKIIAGKTINGTIGVVENALIDPIYWDISMPGKNEFVDIIPEGYNAFVHVIEGEIEISEANISKGKLAVLDDGNQVKIKSISDSRLLLIAGKPLNEPVARGGPFVMNTREEINQAFSDYRSGRFA